MSIGMFVLLREALYSSLNRRMDVLIVYLDKTVRLYKTSTLALGRSAPALLSTEAADDDDESRMSMSERASWEDDTLIRKGPSMPSSHGFFGGLKSHATTDIQLNHPSQLFVMPFGTRI